MKYIDEMLEALKIANEEMKKNDLKKIVMHNLRVNCVKSYNDTYHYSKGGFHCQLVKDDGKKFKIIMGVKFNRDHHSLFDDYTKEMIVKELANGGLNKVTVRFGRITVKGKHIDIIC